MDLEATVRRENGCVTNSSSGLLPQLVEVLQALTESQRFLADRIREAHLELLGVACSRGDQKTWRTSPLHREQAARPLVGTGPIPIGDLSTMIAGDSSELSMESRGVSSDFRSHRGVEVNVITAEDPKIATPTNTPAEATTFASESIANQNAMGQQDDFISSSRDESPITQGDRSYNFFDELDARLADLGNSDGSEDAGS